MELSEGETDVLDFETGLWRYAGAKDTAIREVFGWSPVRHARVLMELLDRPEALAYDAQLVNGLRRSARAAALLVPPMSTVVDELVFARGDLEQAADGLWVDPFLIEVRLSALHVRERAYVGRRLDEVRL